MCDELSAAPNVAIALFESQLPSNVVAARKAGSKYFFTGLPCCRGHICKRFASTRMCLECNRENAKVWRAEHPDKKRELARKWYDLNFKRLRERARDRYLETIDKRREGARRWAAENPELVAFYSSNRRAKLRGSVGCYTLEEIAELLKKQKFKCANSNCRVCIRHKNHKDHIMPLILGGSNAIQNIQLLCPTCNLKKGGKHPIEWAQQNGRLL